MTHADDIARADRAKAALTAVAPILDEIEAAYRERVTETALKRPWLSQELTNLATGVKVVALVREHLEYAINAGKVPAAADAWAAQIAKIPATKRWLGIGP